jgi:hypothetical protein
MLARVGSSNTRSPGLIPLRLVTEADSLGTLEGKLKGVRQEIRNLQVMQMRPGQSAEKLKLLSELERSARAEVKLRLKALEYAKSQIARGS